MRHEARRNFLTMTALAAGWVATSTGWAGERVALPPSRRFLDDVAAGNLEAVREQLTADPGLLYVRDGSGRSAFALALLARHAQVADLLRERGYRPDLHETALAVDWERFDLLATQTPGAVNQDHPIGGTAMYAAAVGGAGSQIWRVYSHGGRPNDHPRGAEGYSALRAALTHPDLELAELTVSTLLGNGADPNSVQAAGSSVLHAAAERGSSALVEVLIRKGAVIEARDDEGRTPVELARSGGSAAVVRLLEDNLEIPRDHSTSRTAYDVDGRPYTAPELIAFSLVERARVVGISHGALDDLRVAVERNPQLAHSIATTTEAAVEAGAHMGRRDIVDLLLEQGVPYSLPTAVMRGDLPRSRSLLAEDPLRIHERGAHDFPLLWYPVLGKSSLEMAELLLDRGAQIERQHILGTTALHYACVGGQLEMVDLLIERGADVNRVGRKLGGKPLTPLQLAEARGHDAVVRQLRQRGATA